jgi:hypothetical protein
MKAELRAASAPEGRAPRDHAAVTAPDNAPKTPARWHLGDAREARIRGWSIGPGGEPSDVRVLANGVPLSIDLVRLDRPDLLRAHPGVAPRPFGFTAEIDPSAWRHADARGRLALQFELDGAAAGAPLVLESATLAAWWRALAGWKTPDEREVWRLLSHAAAAGALARLPGRVAAAIVAAAEARGVGPALRHGDDSGRLARAARPRARVDQLSALEIEGWAIDPVVDEPALVLLCNGQRVACDPAWLERPELARALHAPQARIGWRLGLPAAIWAHADAAGTCAIRVELQGRPLLPQPWRVDADALRGERAALEKAALDRDAEGRGQALRRLALLRAHAEAIGTRGGWTAEDGGAVAGLDAVFDAAAAAEPIGTDTADDRESPGAPPPGLRHHFESWERLILQGWAMDAEAGGEVFELQCNGHPVECLVVRTNRVDVSKAMKVANEYLGFEIQVPADVWRLADAQGACRLLLRVNGAAIGPATMRLDAAALERAIVLALPEPGERIPPLSKAAGMRLRLTALPLLLEHIAASGGAGRLSAAAQARLQAVAGQLAIADLIGAVPARTPDVAAHEQAANQRRTWRLQRLFNAMIERRGGLAPGVLADALDEVLADPDATGFVRGQLLLSLVPLCCGDPAFERLARELPPDALACLGEDGDNWMLSLHVAFLAHAGELAQAAAQLDRIAETPGRGWINTEGVALAVRRALDDPRTDAESLRARASVVRAFLRLLDRLPGDAWSRLHDRALVESAAALLSDDGPWPDALADEVVRVTLRCHALVPRFWSCLGAAAGGLAADERVQAARMDFEAAVAALRMLDAGTGEPARLGGLLERLHAWHARGQRDAMQWMRELAQHAMGRAAGRADPAFDALRRRWPDLFEAGDRWRLECLPAAAARSVDDWRWLAQRVGADRARATSGPDASRAAARVARMAPALEALAADAATARADAPAPDDLDAPSLWPTSVAPARELAAGGNRLRLLSPPERVAALAEARLVVVCVVRNERTMLPHFLAHHRRLGAAHFVVVDNLSDDGARDWLRAQPDVVLYSADTDYRDSHFGVAWQQAVLAAHAQGRWALLADADEFLLYRGCEHTPLPALLDRLDAGGHDAARTLMIDMYPREPLREIDFARVEPAAAAGWFDRVPLLRWHLGGGLYSDGPTWLSALRHRLIPNSPPNAFTAQKLALLRYRPWVRLSEGLHYASGLTPAPAPLFFGHYKYHAGFRDKVMLEIERKQHFDGASEYAHYLGMVAEPDATLFERGVSVHLDDSASLPDPGDAPGPR